jgi:hypothetical protein
MAHPGVVRLDDDLVPASIFLEEIWAAIRHEMMLLAMRELRARRGDASSASGPFPDRSARPVGRAQPIPAVYCIYSLSALGEDAARRRMK